jgi:hypothetical protein
MAESEGARQTPGATQSPDAVVAGSNRRLTLGKRGGGVNPGRAAILGLARDGILDIPTERQRQLEALSLCERYDGCPVVVTDAVRLEIGNALWVFVMTVLQSRGGKICPEVGRNRSPEGVRPTNPGEMPGVDGLRSLSPESA